MAIDLNKTDEYRAGDFSVFNEGNTGVVENVRGRVEKKGSNDADNAPDYKLFFKDEKGEVSDGFYYQDDPDSSAFKDFQAQRLIRLCKGLLGEEFEFPLFETPTQALDEVMKLVAPVMSKVPLRVAVAYGTTKRPSQYLRVKTFGRFAENMEIFKETKLRLENTDQKVRPEVVVTSETDLSKEMSKVDLKADDTPNWLKEDE